jgi:hypothetical protein
MQCWRHLHHGKGDVDAHSAMMMMMMMMMTAA